MTSGVHFDFTPRRACLLYPLHWLVLLWRNSIFQIQTNYKNCSTQLVPSGDSVLHVLSAEIGFN